MLRLDGVDFAYDGQPALKGVSLELPAGCLMGLLGPNGSGKSTLLRCASGLLRPQRGTVFLEGTALGALTSAEIARKVSVVAQDFYMDFGFTVRELVSLGRTPYMPAFGWESPRDRDMVERVLEETGLRELAERFVSEVSGGERQRAFIAMALAQEPALLLLDEPTSHLDVRHQFEIMELISRLHRQGKMTVLATFHDLTLAAAYCERAALLENGAIAAQGPTAEVLRPDRLQKIYGVAAWSGSHPLLPGRTLFAFAAGPEPARQSVSPPATPGEGARG